MEDSDLDALLASDDFEDSLLAQLDEDEQRQSTVPVEPEPTTEGEPPRDWRDGNDAYQPTGFGQIGNFMRNKRVKLQHQYQARLAESPASVAEQGPPQFFKGVAIHINGHTGSHSLRHLIHLITLHGGTYHAILDRRSLVTHIVASNLTPSKAESFKEYKIVKPEWVVECVKEGRRIGWARFGLLGAGNEGEREQEAPGGDGATRIEGEDATGSRGAQRSLFSLGVGASSSSAQTPSSTSTPPSVMPKVDKGKQKEKASTETMESLSDRGARLARAALASSSSSSSSSKTLPFPARWGDFTSSSTSDFDRPIPGTRASKPSIFSPLRATSAITSTSSLPEPVGPTKHSWLPDASPPAATKALLNDASWMAKHTSASTSFLPGYFAQSRLHHLSSWKAELQALVASLQPEQRGRVKRDLSGTERDERTVLHVDFDCFFVSAGLVSRPELRGKAVAVCHARAGEGTVGGGGEGSTSEIASCSYEARDKGVKNGMSLGKARELCPEIITIPFEFEVYKSIASKFYEILLAHAVLLQAVSIDEVLMEVETPGPVSPPSASDNADSDSKDPALIFAHQLRAKIKAATGCEASIGISHNILLARLASRRAKPASAYHLLPAEVTSFLAELPVEELPGIGWSTRRKLEEEVGVRTVGELGRLSEGERKRVLGQKQGEKFGEYARGVDKRELEVGRERQSVSAEVNYGIRFEKAEEVERFVLALGQETASRLRNLGLQANSLTLKIMTRHPDSPIDPPKFLGHGHCVTTNTSERFAGGATDDGAVVGRKAWELLGKMKAELREPRELRGIGIQLSKLERDGVSVDEGAVEGVKAKTMEKGQRTLSFGVAPPKPPVKPSARKEEAPVKPEQKELEPSPSPQEAPPARQLKKGPSLIILSDSDEDPTATTTTVLGKRPAAAPPAVNPLRKALKKEPAPPPPPAARARSTTPHIPSLFQRRRRAAPPTPPSTQQVPESELLHYGLDPEAYRELPREVQSEQLGLARRSKFAPPREKDRKQATLRGRSSKVGLGQKGKSVTPAPGAGQVMDLTVSPSPSPPKPAVAVSPTTLTDAEILSLGYSIADFRQLPSSLQHEQAREHQAHRTAIAKLTVPSNRRRAPRSAEERALSLREVRVKEPPKFAQKVELEDVRGLIESWMQKTAGQGEAPKDADLARLSNWLEKLVEGTKGGRDVAKARDILEWWEVLLGEECGAREDAEGTTRIWWDAWSRTRERVDAAVKRTMGMSCW